MAIDFNGINQGSVNTRHNTQVESHQTTAKSQVAHEQVKSAPTRGENVSLSAQAKNLKSLEQQIKEQPDIDDARVESIKAALQDGSFKIDAEKLAQKMLDFDQSIFGTGS